MYPVFMAQWMKDKRKPFTILLFIGLSIIATLIFGGSAQQTQTTIPIFGTGPNAEEIEEKWVDLLNTNEQLRFVITEEDKAREDVIEGRREMAIQLMDSDYRLIVATELPNNQFAEQLVHQAYTKEAQLVAVAGPENADKVRTEIENYLETPPITVETQSLAGGEIPSYNMGMQLLFGFTLFIAMFTIGFKVNGITADKVSGIWNRLILSPVSKTQMYVGHLVYSFAVGFFQVVAVLLIFDYLMGYELGSLPMIIVLAAVYTLSTVSLATLITGIVKTPEQFQMVYPSLAPLIPIISGVYMMPGTISSPILNFIGDLFPLGHAVQAMMDVALYNASWSDLAFPITIMLLIGVMCMGIGINMVERRNG